MIGSLPDNGVSAPLAARSSSSTEKNNESAKSQSTAGIARESAPRDVAGHALQTLFNVTIDCVRGRYDR
jgi:hypothetical protein